MAGPDAPLNPLLGAELDSQRCNDYHSKCIEGNDGQVVFREDSVLLVVATMQRRRSVARVS